jgi:hypothetical protein
VVRLLPLARRWRRFTGIKTAEFGFLDASGRVEDWRGVPKVWPSLLLPVSVGSASIAKP